MTAMVDEDGRRRARCMKREGVENEEESTQPLPPPLLFVCLGVASESNPLVETVA